MANNEYLNDEVLENAAGGAVVNTTDWNGAHWQATDHQMGSTFIFNGLVWYRIQSGDTLGKIAHNFGTTINHLKANNPKTITNPSMIYAGDTIAIRRA